LTVEDKTAQVEVIAFPQVFAKHGALLGKERLVILEGRVDIQEETVKLLASRFWDVTAVAKPTNETILFVKISPEQE
ncbi:hypothetical protein MXD81_27635, partial [Microbacteriaceae bacterium K1510]|nr:hypothetical protein [Microbacteriaceae bacterium K1510]